MNIILIVAILLLLGLCGVFVALAIKIVTSESGKNISVEYCAAENSCDSINNVECWRNVKMESKQKKSKCLLVSWILGVLYAIYIVTYFAGATTSQTDAAAALGAGIATMLVMPHMIVAVLAAIFNVLGWAMNKRGFALTAGILYAVAAVLFPIYAMFVLVQMILSFVGFAKLKTIIANNTIQNQAPYADA